MRGRVWVLQRSNGKVLWSKYVGSAIESSPVVRYGVDYFGAHNGRLYALDLERRKFRWMRGGNCKITSSAAITGGTLFIGDYCGRRLAVRTRDGRTRLDRRRQRQGLRHARRARPARVRAVLDRRLADRVLDRRPLLWRVGTGSYVYSSPAVWAGRVFFGSYNGRMYAVSASSGTRALVGARGRAGSPARSRSSAASRTRARPRADRRR